MTDDFKPIEVSRKIEAPPTRIFEVLSNPQRHAEFDGTGMLRGPVFDRPITGAGDVFAMKMYSDRLGGDYLMLNHVVDYEPDRRIFWAPAPGDPAPAGGRTSVIGQPPGHRWGYVLEPDGDDATIVTEIYDCSAAPDAVREILGTGEQWVPAMTKSLALLDAICLGA
jgi:uncharacterized protein YndB with AHSA1/START domain